MAYNTKPIVTDVDGNPISQYYNPETDQYEPVEGQAGANKVVLYNADGTENNNLSLIPILEKLSQLTGTIIDEETRKSNELQRIALYNQIKQMLENGELKGEKGDTGIGLNYRWQGTYLGIKREDETEFVYVDLKGEKGDKGDKGDPGVIENLTKQHVLDALQYTPVKSVNNVMPDGSGNVEIDIDISEIENRIGNVEEDLAAHKADYVTQINAKANKWNNPIYFPLPLQNGWTGTLEYSSIPDLGLVHIKGTIIAGTTAWNTTVATLGTSIRPSSDMAVPALRNSEPYDSVSGLSIIGVFLKIRKPASDTVEEGDTLNINYVYKI